ncbi:MAG: amino acid aldolase [Chitinophagales bacterium]|nr:MAG: amino acid aldolase [Chitinophagales bacterium]
MYPSYSYYKNSIKGLTLPLALVDLKLFDENAQLIAQRAGNKKIRIATKSLRCIALIKRALQSHPAYNGLMCYSAEEAVWLSQKGFDDILIGYPVWHEKSVEAACSELHKGKTITFMVDLPEHIHHLNTIGEKSQTIIPLCIDADMSSVFWGLRFGVWRSSITRTEQALVLYEKIKNYPWVQLVGLMGYEAAIAGVGDNLPGKRVQNLIVRVLKHWSAKEVAQRRDAMVKALRKAGAQLRFVNGGGTGSLEWTTQEQAVTEVTAGSGFYASALFDFYTNFRHKPAAVFALEITRHPAPHIFTCHGGGYIASGAVGADKQPRPYLPEGMQLIAQEGAGEVQTPIYYSGMEQLALGDPVFFRHAKAGELCERFNELLLIDNGRIADTVPTYRGEGKCFV